MFSATMPQSILDIARRTRGIPRWSRWFAKLTVPNIQQYYLEVKQSNKFEILTRLIDIHNPKLALIFCNTKMKVTMLLINLREEDILQMVAWGHEAEAEGSSDG